MKTGIIAKVVQTTDNKANDRRFRNILANSGLTMESGDSRSFDSLYVMQRDGKLMLISKLNSDPDKQSEKYKVNFVANHGHMDAATGEQIIDIEDIIGDAKVWLKDGKLYGRVYFANDDEKADHAYAISDNASYSDGIDWYDEG